MNGWELLLASIPSDPIRQSCRRGIACKPDFSNSGFDRGHMTPNADRDKETSIPINQATFLMSNMIAQSPDTNQGPWADLENFRTLLPANEVYIVAGPHGSGGTGSAGFATTIANGHVAVPSSTWKVVLVIPKATTIYRA